MKKHRDILRVVRAQQNGSEQKQCKLLGVTIIILAFVAASLHGGLTGFETTHQPDAVWLPFGIAQSQRSVARGSPFLSDSVFGMDQDFFLSHAF